MNTRYSRQVELRDVAEAAYSRARREVYDRLPAGANADGAALSQRQQAALDDLRQAEADLERSQPERGTQRSTPAPHRMTGGRHILRGDLSPRRCEP
jgi:hypothetical protein